MDNWFYCVSKNNLSDLITRGYTRGYYTEQYDYINRRKFDY